MDLHQDPDFEPAAGALAKALDGMYTSIDELWDAGSKLRLAARDSGQALVKYARSCLDFHRATKALRHTPAGRELRWWP